MKVKVSEINCNNAVVEIDKKEYTIFRAAGGLWYQQIGNSFGVSVGEKVNSIVERAYQKRLKKG